LKVMVKSSPLRKKTILLSVSPAICA